jgi:hypothetical protein
VEHRSVQHFWRFRTWSRPIWDVTMVLLHPQPSPQLQHPSGAGVCLLTVTCNHILCRPQASWAHQTWTKRKLAVYGSRVAVAPVVPMGFNTDSASAQRGTIHVPCLPTYMFQRGRHNLFTTWMAGNHIYPYDEIPIQGGPFTFTLQPTHSLLTFSYHYRRPPSRLFSAQPPCP